MPDDDWSYDVYDRLEDEALARLRDADAQSDEDTEDEDIKAENVFLSA